MKILRKVARFLGYAILGVMALTVAASLLGYYITPVNHPPALNVVDDVTRLYPVVVDRVTTPTTVDEIIAEVRTHPGPISIGGGRYSMGGQTATEGALQLDMRDFDMVIAFDPKARTITVQPGIRWREIQDKIDPDDLSVKIMQTYANFTVGGSLSVNVHGRYVGLGPIILSVCSIKLVLADGTLVDASPTLNPEIFYGAIGGYGGLGVIVEVTLDLDRNQRVARESVRMPLAEYTRWFRERVRDDPDAVFHNADLYPMEFERVNAVTYRATTAPATVQDRLMPVDRSYRFERSVLWMISETPIGLGLREHVIDPLLFAGEQVEWRNYEASYDVEELEPRSRENSTYVLQEYFIPVGRLEEFVPRMAEVFRRNDVNVINVSIRHARPDPGSLLAWAREEVFALVVYYKQDTDAAARAAVTVWTREMIDEALNVGGTYYLPYQPQATIVQFTRAYPRAGEYFALKKRLDPTNKFRNKLWDRYYTPQVDPGAAPLASGTRAHLDGLPDYQRDEGQTYLTHPEWYIVYSSDEYADWLGRHSPSDFPYLTSIGQFWVNYREASKLTADRPFNWGYHVMLWVIGTSYSAELAIKGLYENTIGRITDWTLGDDSPTAEERWAYAAAADYGKFIHVRPWYEYPYSAQLSRLWSEVPWWGEHALRKLERRVILSLEYLFKAGYAAVIEWSTHAAYGTAEDRIRLVVSGPTDALFAAAPQVEVEEPLDAGRVLISSPRYDEFRDTLFALAQLEPALRIHEIAGNDDIFLTGTAPSGWRLQHGGAAVVYEMSLPGDPTRKRVALRAPVSTLLPALKEFVAQGELKIDHIYDY